MKRISALLLLVFLVIGNCSCSLQEQFSIEHVPVYGEQEMVWYNPLQSYPKTYASEISPEGFYDSPDRRHSFSDTMSWNEETIEGCFEYYQRIYPGEMFDRIFSTVYAYFKTSDATYANNYKNGKCYWYQADEKNHSPGEDIGAQERIALLDYAKKHFHAEIPAHLAESFVYTVDPQGNSMSYTLQIPQLPQLKDFGLHVSLFCDGSLRSLRADMVSNLSNTTVEQLIQDAHALSGQEVIPALQARLDRLYTLGENSIFLFSSEDSPQRAAQRKDRLLYESGRWTDYQVISDSIWAIAPNGKLYRQFDLQITTTLTPKEGEPLSSVHTASLYFTVSR